MMKKHGLGRGLGALIPENNTEVGNHEGLISIQLIKPNKDQPRKNFDDDKVEQLAKSIKEHGIIQPLITYKDGDNYIIIAGERRWRAAKKCKLKEVPVVVVDKKSDKQVLELSLIENIQREDLNSIEVALGYKSLIEDFSLTHDELSERIGKSRTSITNTLRLLQLDSRVQEYLIDKVITEGHGRALLSLEDKELQYKLSQKIIDDGLSVRDIERMVKTLGKKEKKKTKEDYSIFLKEYSTQLEEKLGTKVSFKSKSKNKGKIEIEYYSIDDLERLMKILS
ncbi:ParB/RepB/Spo0J family partition protein [Oceanirhabdus sp. W0125-5]|uniref:ParB/RepB/Spo0J family partition protein n=1 Tax=Oceanirhabdus sp. W0125-5 TaxID=2999116 RepID=UPI0022F2FCA1|nr:ParB/RepB/Spo0J family partition protein [Oceanirhabdus sp. W0125-5]WBW99684.1 ParB/RepB/Spo0J family partition protein [Oceanirhabdus sp. W0125-5]